MTEIQQFRYIFPLPGPVVLFDGALTFPFRDFVAHVVDSHPAFTKTPAGWRLAGRLLSSLDAAIGDGGPWILKTDQEWKPLHDAIEDGQAGAPSAFRMDTAKGTREKLPIPPREFVAFTDAIAHATGTPPNGHEAD